ncbi:MAG: YbgC/FadM family acyl-CoA thioesterase [Fluviibacter phosphoraccumulans]
MLLDNFHIRACYADTDAAGVIHHARYLEFCERSRTEWLDRIGAGPTELEGKLGHVLVIRETTLAFHKPGRLNDQLVFSHEVTHKGRSQLTLLQKVFSTPNGQLTTMYDQSNLLVTATFHLVCVDTKVMKSTSLPDVFN